MPKEFAHTFKGRLMGLPVDVTVTAAPAGQDKVRLAIAGAGIISSLELSIEDLEHVSAVISRAIFAAGQVD